MRVWFLSVALALMCVAQTATAGTILIVGDSISAAFGLDTRQGWVSLLEQRLREQGYDDKVVNASISGDTSAGGLARLPALLAEHKPDVVIVELGGNDGLRGQLNAIIDDIAALVELKGMSLQAAADEVVQNKLTALGGDGGIIAVAPDGQVAWSFNTSGMYRGRAAKGEPVSIGIYKDEP